MRKNLIVTFLVAAVATLALAAIPRTKAIEHVSPEKFTNLIVEPSTGLFSIDFAELSNVALGTPCRNSSAATANGCVVGDTCLASTTFGLNDGGTALPATATLSCYVSAANAVTFKLCWQATDAGTYDPGAGVFTGKCIH